MKLCLIRKGLFFIVLMAVFSMAPSGFAKDEGANGTSREQRATEPQMDTKDPLPMDIVLVLDNSGSMKKNDPDFLVKEVVTTFFENWSEGARIGLVVFDENARLVLSLPALDEKTGNETKLPEVLNTIDYKGQRTNIAAGVERAIYEFKTHGRPKARRVCVLLTDGHMDVGSPEQDVEKERGLREELADEASEKGIRIYGIAFTEDADYPLLQALAQKTNGDYFRALEAEGLKDVFGMLKASILKEEPRPRPDEKKSDDDGKKPVPSSPPSVPSPGKDESGLGINTVLLAVIALALICLVLFLFFRRDSQKTVVQQVVQPIGDDQDDVPEVTITYIGKDSGVAADKKDLNFSAPFAPGTKKVFRQSEIRMGRNEQNTLCIQNPEKVISGEHAKIIFRNGDFFLVDLKSTNGTFLNGKRLEEPKEYLLKSGEEFSLYIYKFKFFVTGGQEQKDTEVMSEETVVRQFSTPPGKGELPKNSASSRPQAKKGTKGGESRKSQKAQKPEEIGKPSSRGKNSVEPDDSTIGMTGRCTIHPSKQATHICVVCKKGFCSDCVTIKEGRATCHGCKGTGKGA